MMVVVITLLVAACVHAESSGEQSEKLPQRLKFLKRKTVDHVNPMGDSIEEINVKSGVAAALFQGDIILPKVQRNEFIAESETRAKRQAYNDKKYPGHRWSNGVPYIFADYLGGDAKAAFKKAAQLWMDNTCINFTEHQKWKKGDPKPPLDFLFVYNVEGCSSKVGKQGGPQELSLGKGCESVGIAAHEIGHALGFFHTQARHDRDEFVTINKENVEKDWLPDFDKQKAEFNNNYGITYDYGSIMHYGAMSSNAAINKSQPIIVPNDVNYTETLGSDIIAFYDLLMMNKYYNCLDACKGKEPDCKNGGFVHPRNCSMCICPSGYGGQLCGEKPSGCGAVLEASEEWAPLEDSLGGVKGDERDGYKKCTYWIKAKNDKKIEVKIVELPEDVAVDGCIYAGVEVKTHSDQSRTGYRFCSKDDVESVLKSNSSLVPVITYNGGKNITTTKLQYRILEEN